MKEVLDYYLPAIRNSKALDELSLKAGNYFLVSTHREENVDNRASLEKILSVLDNLADEYKIPVIVSTHPRTRKRLEELKDYKAGSLIRFMKPFGFLDYNFLQMNAKCVLSDSGTISEESAILSFPAISLRQSMERPEAQDAGTIILTGFDSSVVLSSIGMVIRQFKEIGIYGQIPLDYSVKDTSWRVLKLISGNARLSNLWHGIKS
jgi:UDP-N-acetylglucosamine 2-epimerase (non-hydrolysing)